MSEEKTISLEDFKANFTVKVSRYECYPIEEPTCYCVGLIITNNNGKGSRYIDTQVPFTQAVDKSDEEIVKLGYQNMENTILSWATQIHVKNPVIGMILTI